MLAHHPRTGKEIRVIQTDATVWRESKTLIFSGEPSIWDTVYDGLLSDGTGPLFRLVLGAVEAAEFKMMATKSKLVLLSKVALDSIGAEGFKKLGVTNVIYLEEVHLMYPHLGDAWDGTKEDAAVIMAGLLRYRKLAGAWSARGPFLCVKEDSAPPRLWWITQFFKHEKSKRAAEIRKCLRENSKSRLIDKILLLNESPQEFQASPKIEEEVIGHRLTYQDVFDRIYEIPDDVIVVFANADIFIDDVSWKDIWNLNLEDKFLALLRYDVSQTWDTADAKIFGPRADSQDTWVVRAVDVKKRAKEVWSSLNFKFGKMGCDNLLALEMMKQKFLVSNPCQTLKTYHVHSSDIRNYAKTDVIEAPVFHYIQPSAINDLQAEFKLPKVKTSVLKRVPRGSVACIEAWKKSLKPALEDSFEEFTPKAEQHICIDRPCFQTTEGLVFDSEKMYIGETTSSKLLWNNSKIHGMMPTLGVGRALIVPWPVGADKSKEVYCLRYLSKVLRLWNSGPGEFFGSEEPVFEQVLQLFKWNQESLPIITREDNSLIWCKEGAVGFCHEENPVLKEDMDALRKYMRGWVGEISGRKIVIMEDGILLTNPLVLEIEKSLEAAGYDVKVVYPSKTSIERLVDVFSGAWGMVAACGMSSIGWNWMLPVGAHVFEVNSSKTTGIEISSAAGLNHYFVSKVPAEIVEQVSAAFAVAEAEAKENPSLPTVFLPSATTGFFGHPGDSFREMVGLWAKAGYINVRRHDGAQVWWGSVGADGVLLYDRPTNEWRLAAPEAEREWRLALFGNPKVGSASAAVPWTFWARRPSLLEAAAASVKGYDERRQGPVFYGKTENAVQERRRQGDWVSVCEEFVMVKGDEKYPFTQSEYLEKLGSSRFGLCLPGYGFKCHREIECMAMGCVPLVSEWVDMASYANPPVEGKHYIRLGNSRDIPGVVASVSKESWEEMSAACRTWWRENASCQGSFELTRRLVTAELVKPEAA